MNGRKPRERAMPSTPVTEDVFKVEYEILGKNSSVFCVSAQIPIMKYSYLIITAVLAMTLNSLGQIWLFWGYFW